MASCAPVDHLLPAPCQWTKCEAASPAIPARVPSCGTTVAEQGIRESLRGPTLPPARSVAQTVLVAASQWGFSANSNVVTVLLYYTLGAVSRPFGVDFAFPAKLRPEFGSLTPNNAMETCSLDTLTHLLRPVRDTGQGSESGFASVAAKSRPAPGRLLSWITTCSCATPPERALYARIGLPAEGRATRS